MSTAQARAKSALRGCPDLGAWHFSCKFSNKIALVTRPWSMCISTARTKRAAKFGGRGFFSCQFSRESGFVRCPCAFPLRRLAQSLRCGVVPILGRGIFLVNSRINCSCEMPMCISTARTKRAAKFGAHHFPVHSRVKVALWDAHVHFDNAGSHKVCG